MTGDSRKAARQPTTPPCARSFVIGPDKKIKLQLIYPMSTGRNFNEILRALDSIQLTTKHKVSTPANWKPGDDIIISGAVSNEEAAKLLPGGFKTVKRVHPHGRTAEVVSAALLQADNMR